MVMVASVCVDIKSQLGDFVVGLQVSPTTRKYPPRFGNAKLLIGAEMKALLHLIFSYSQNARPAYRSGLRDVCQESDSFIPISLSKKSLITSASCHLPKFLVHKIKSLSSTTYRKCELPREIVSSVTET